MHSTKYDAENKLWSGTNLPSLFNPKISLGQVLLSSMKVHGSKIAQICDDTGNRMDYNDLWSKTVRVAQNLQKLGYSKAGVVGYSGIDPNVAPVICAAFCLGCPIIALSPSYGKADMIHLLNITKPKLMFCTVERYAIVSECLKEVGNEARMFTFDGEADGSDSVQNLFAETGMEKHFTPVPVDGANDVAAILCSSGTTGLAKGVALSHAAIAEKCGDIALLNAGDIHYCPGSLFWISGLFMFVVSSIRGSTAIITKRKFSVDLQLRLVEQYKISFLMNSPHHLVMMLKSESLKTSDLSSIKCYWIGGNRMPIGGPVEINKYLPNGRLCTAYGLTEISLLLSTTFDAFVEKDTAGKLVNGSVVKIVDDNGFRCGVGVDGQICIKNNHPFLGYYGNEKATAEAFDSEGFILTGDLGRFDEDGYLYIVDRVKEIFKYCSCNVYPSEIESWLIQSPDIELACVVGIPDDLVGDMPAAAVVRKKNSTITEQDIYDMVAEKFEDHKHLRGGVHFMDAFPTSIAGKVLRREIKNTIIRLAKC